MNGGQRFAPGVRPVAPADNAPGPLLLPVPLITVADALPRPVDEQARSLFEQAMAPAQGRLTRERFEDAVSQTMQAPPPVPSLPGLPQIAQPQPGTALDDATRECLIETVERLMVGNVHGVGHQVRMDLKDDFMPGVSVVVQQTAAQLQVVFECSALASRQRLDRAAPEFARALARRLGRDVAVRVDGAGGGYPPLVVEARADSDEATA